MANADLKEFLKSFDDLSTTMIKDEKTSETNRDLDVIHILSIFQILGFTVTHTDVLNASEMIGVCSDKKGLKINISCNHSGVRCTLERANDCHCPPKMVDTFQHIMHIEEPEKRCESYEKFNFLNIPEVEKNIVQTGFKHLVDYMYMATKYSDENENISKTETKDNLLNENIIEKSEIPLKKIIPARNDFSSEDFSPSDTQFEKDEEEIKLSIISEYRSLQFLKDKNLEQDLPERVVAPNVSSSSPNLSQASKCVGNTSSPVINMVVLKQGYSKLLSVQETIKDVIDIFEKSQELPRFSFDVSNIKASTESLVFKKPALVSANSDSNLVRKTSIKPLCRPPIRSTSSISPFKDGANSNITSTSKLNNAKKLVENVSPKVKVTNKKYAHVKSTIPKGNPTKK